MWQMKFNSPQTYQWAPHGPQMVFFQALRIKSKFSAKLSRDPYGSHATCSGVRVRASNSFVYCLYRIVVSLLLSETTSHLYAQVGRRRGSPLSSQRLYFTDFGRPTGNRSPLHTERSSKGPPMSLSRPVLWHASSNGPKVEGVRLRPPPVHKRCDCSDVHTRHRSGHEIDEGKEPRPPDVSSVPLIVTHDVR